MIPIFEQGDGRGIGHSSASFRKQFGMLCKEHIQSDRAKGFAFIFYNFHDYEFKNILKDQGVFAQLDRLSGNHLSVFYLHQGGHYATTRFNKYFLSRVGVEEPVRLPCVVFFTVSNDLIEDFKVAELQSSSYIHGFHELYGVIERYIEEDLISQTESSKYLRWLKGSAKFISIETFRTLLISMLDRVV